MSADLVIEGLVKWFGDTAAVDGIDLRVRPGEFLTLLGPSGCGKTTTLRCVAGLELPSAGEISFRGRVFAAPGRAVFVPPDKRRIGMVFQSYALWPHMTVRANVGYPLKMAKVPRAEIRDRVHEMLGRVGLAERADEMAVSLSGGQQQRVALARAMASRPELLLFDEPLSNLDAKLRYQLRDEIRSLHDQLGTTSVYVTHDQEEAMALSDRIVVMNAGRIEQVGPPRELYSQPRNAFVADFMGYQNILPGVVAEVRGDGHLVRVDGSTLTVAVPGVPPGPAGTATSVAFRASAVRLDPPADGPAAALAARVLRSTYLGRSLNLLVEVAGVRLRTQLDEEALGRVGPELPGPGDELTVHLPARAVVPLAPVAEAAPAAVG
ncbi:spermidine/putrescine ABC transporter ATP-binding protein PotA [Plantactinospora mayteni]|uniref:Spermidine/putrescine import ATP-binding protein PotA n=1 Tax=Plantactinospora mayteni TaxID=566021 RepID=A0ABQ4F3S5_9ACTN|nr:ABC transporter ATP-binding protein [Plantactinospora mayteni]GIH01560.1 spermidine/putrescine import ATP-binding protein PotA [Plantactinospora mayteni]